MWNWGQYLSFCFVNQEYFLALEMLLQSDHSDMGFSSYQCQIDTCWSTWIIGANFGSSSESLASEMLGDNSDFAYSSFVSCHPPNRRIFAGPSQRDRSPCPRPPPPSPPPSLLSSPQRLQVQRLLQRAQQRLLLRPLHLMERKQAW